jgi:hypothetical protein
MASEFKLLAGERVLARVTPHILSFYELYLVWMWAILVSIIFMAYGQELGDMIGNPVSSFTDYLEWMTTPKDNILIRKIDFLPSLEGLNDTISPLNKYMKDYAEIGLWLTIILLTAIPITVLRIEFGWTPIMAAYGITTALIGYCLELDPQTTYIIGITLALLALYLVNLYRKAHTFHITDRRIITEVKLIIRKYNELSYDKINNVIMDVNLIGKIFGFGTIIPITASGLGMGHDAISLGVGAAQSRGDTILGGILTGERGIQTPRTRSMYALFGVPNPEKIKDLITENMHDHIQAPHLKKINQTLDNINQQLQTKKD